MNTLKFCIVFCFSSCIYAQELQGTVTINSESIGQTNQQIFKTLETALTNFINSKRWTEKEFSAQERIQFDMFINVNSFNSNRFEASLQVQSSRPVFASSFQTPVFTFKDDNFNFS